MRMTWCSSFAKHVVTGRKLYINSKVLARLTAELFRVWSFIRTSVNLLIILISFNTIVKF